MTVSAGLDRVAPAFVDMAHSIVWASVATVDKDGKPRTRILHPIWEWDGTDLFGWIATAPTPLKRDHIAAHPWVSVSYWTTSHDTCAADCLVEWYTDDDTCSSVWQRFRTGPEPVGYDPAIIPQWKDGPDRRGVRGAAVGPLPVAGHAGHHADRGPGRGAELERQ